MKKLIKYAMGIIITATTLISFAEPCLPDSKKKKAAITITAATAKDMARDFLFFLPGNLGLFLKFPSNPPAGFNSAFFI